jgi:hypothetical protein
MRFFILASLVLLTAHAHAADKVRVLIQQDNPDQAARIQADCEWLSDGSVSSIGVKSAISKIEGEGRKAGANTVIVRRSSRTEAAVSYFKCK